MFFQDGFQCRKIRTEAQKPKGDSQNRNFRGPTHSWPYSVGFINEDMIAVHLLPAKNDTIVLLCGPPLMINFACNPALDKLGYHPDTRFAF